MHEPRDEHSNTDGVIEVIDVDDLADAPPGPAWRRAAPKITDLLPPRWSSYISMATGHTSGPSTALAIAGGTSRVYDATIDLERLRRDDPAAWRHWVERWRPADGDAQIHVVALTTADGALVRAEFDGPPVRTMRFVAYDPDVAVATGPVRDHSNGDGHHDLGELPAPADDGIAAPAADVFVAGPTGPPVAPPDVFATGPTGAPVAPRTDGAFLAGPTGDPATPRTDGAFLAGPTGSPLTPPTDGAFSAGPTGSPLTPPATDAFDAGPVGERTFPPIDSD